MAFEAPRASYHPPSLEGSAAVIEWMSPEEIEASAGYVLQTLVRAYTAEFEREDVAQPLPAGTIAARYRPQDEAGVSEFRGKMLHSVEQNESQYWRVTQLDAPYIYERPAVPGFIKVTPSRASLLQKAKIHTPNAYVNDVVVDPSVQRQRLGTMLLHTGLKLPDFDEDRSAVLESYDGMPASHWFKKLGFVAKSGVVSHPVKLGGQILRQTQYETRVGGAIKKLEDRHPWLRETII